jgi:hypothetical protein
VLADCVGTCESLDGPALVYIYIYIYISFIAFPIRTSNVVHTLPRIVGQMVGSAHRACCHCTAQS